ncbi:MAG: hypothetical protein IKM01_02295 [Clostridia bacterium]|nr:hypothetical protein [Clostridia bacterium]
MKTFINKTDSKLTNLVAFDDMILTTELPTTAGSKMLDGYVSLFEAEVVNKLKKAGYNLAGKVNVGEFNVDLMGETSYFGAVTDESGNLVGAISEVMKDTDIVATIAVDVNGAQRRAVMATDLVYLKPTYGTVSRFGIIPTACSGESVCVIARNASDLEKILNVIAGHDDKDGTSIDDSRMNSEKASAKAIEKVAFLKDMFAISEKDACEAKKALESVGVATADIDSGVLSKAGSAWNILMSAELTNNVSRYDGVKFGYRSSNYTNIDELYTNSRTEAFGELLKTAILYGSEVLSTNNYDKMYDKSLRVRRVISEAMDSIFAEYDAIALPVASKKVFTAKDVADNAYLAYEESRFTAISTIVGLPTIVKCGYQIIGRAFAENALLDLLRKIEKEGA